jgi:hypothetical protein
MHTSQPPNGHTKQRKMRPPYNRRESHPLPDKVSTPSTGLGTVKILLNSVISTPNARFVTFDLKDFYLDRPMARKEYMRIAITSTPSSIIDQYHILDLVHHGFVLVEINRGMYGLPQAGILAYNQIVARLIKHGYAPCAHTTGLWTHDTRNVTFCLIVDDFGIKYINRCDAEHPLPPSKTYTSSPPTGLAHCTLL